MDRATELKIIHKGIMEYATRWAKGNGNYWEGMAAGLIYAYLILTNDQEGHNEYYAMLGL